MNRNIIIKNFESAFFLTRPSTIAHVRTNLLKDEYYNIYEEWKELINMSYESLEAYYNSNFGKDSGLSQSEAKKHGVSRGRSSARAILNMLLTHPSLWTKNQWRWARKQIAFIKRMRGNRGKLYDQYGLPTRKLMSLMIWGHYPFDLVKRENSL